MRFTITIPDVYYGKIKTSLDTLGFTTINDFLLDLIRRQMGGEGVPMGLLPEVVAPPAIAAAAFDAAAATFDVAKPSVEIPTAETYQTRLDLARTIIGGGLPEEKTSYRKCAAQGCPGQETKLYRVTVDDRAVTKWLCKEHTAVAEKAGEYLHYVAG